MSVGDPFHLLMKMSLNAGFTNARGTFGAPDVYRSATAMLDIPNPVTFDSTTSFFFCTDINKVPHAYCEIVGFAVWYVFETASNGATYSSGLYRRNNHYFYH